MSASTTAHRLAEAIGEATKSSRFCVAGCLPAVDPGIEVDGLGALVLPLQRGAAKKLVACCQVAPYGKGTETLVDTKVRKTFELDPKKFRLSQEWNSAVARAARLAAEQLGLPAEQVEARLYKLLVYEKGGFFLPHRDSEKQDGMVASLIVVLANPFEGGALVVRHGALKQTLRFEQAAQGKAPCYAAFYADCEHEVQRVTHGMRLCLAYNLVLKPKRDTRADADKPAVPADALAESIKSWTAKQPARPLVFALEHHYTQRGLALELLKGADRQLAELIVPAAESSDCLVHLAQVSRHLLQFADDGSFGRGQHWGYRPRGAIAIGETYEDELQATDWTDLQGKKQPWGPIALELSAIVSSIPIAAWKPTSEDFEGYTGNAGNTLDRWYHRSAIVLWHRAHHFDVVASCGTAVSIPLCRSMVAKLAKTPKKRFDEARTDCIRFARAIIARWPRAQIGYWHGAPREPSPQEDFPDLLLALRDRDTIALFLSKLAEQDQLLPLASFVGAACREFGWSAFARELRQLMAARPDDRDPLSMRAGQTIPLRDLEWLSAFCLEKAADPDRSALAHELCALAVERFCAPRPPRPAYYGPSARREPSASASSLPLLLKALVATGRDEDLSRVIRFVESSPEEFSLEDCQVPALQSLVPWSRKQFGVVPPPLLSWLASVRQQLESATARQPAPPADWARPADVACTCPYCAQLKAFLADPANEVGRIPAREDMRHHLI
ncbi:MAG: 2OG-Fe(II) oxygenase, partial [Gemmataceae bacterium]|nr:2OG-Fe(II) oxygenase [Gemmataceae bacterium]